MNLSADDGRKARPDVPDDIARRQLSASLARQGLPSHIEDAAVIERVATVLRRSRARARRDAA